MNTNDNPRSRNITLFAELCLALSTQVKPWTDVSCLLVEFMQLLSSVTSVYHPGRSSVAAKIIQTSFQIFTDPEETMV